MPSMDHKIKLTPEQQAKLDAAKEWTKRNWKPFVAGAAVAGVTIFVFRGRVSPTIINNTNNVAPIFNNDNSSLVNFGGHMTKVVKRLSDGQIWETVTEAAGEAGCSMSFMSRHLNGHEPNVFNETYKIIGVSTTG